MIIITESNIFSKRNLAKIFVILLIIILLAFSLIHRRLLQTLFVFLIAHLVLLVGGTDTRTFSVITNDNFINKVEVAVILLKISGNSCVSHGSGNAFSNEISMYITGPDGTKLDSSWVLDLNRFESKLFDF